MYNVTTTMRIYTIPPVFSKHNSILLSTISSFYNLSTFSSEIIPEPWEDGVKEDGCEIPPLPEELQALDSCLAWGKVISFLKAWPLVSQPHSHGRPYILV